MAETLFKDAEYEGRYVAIRSIDDAVVIADGKDVDYPRQVFSLEIPE